MGATSAIAADGSEAQLDQLVADVCERQVVLLGEEGSHGGGRTIEVKTQLVERLVQECGFKRVAFEAAFYEFQAFNSDLARGRGTRQQLADAIGGVWASATQMQPLIDWLFSRAMSGGLQLGGIDFNPGSRTGWFAERELPALLAADLPQAQREPCRLEFDRHNSWRYNDAERFDDVAKARLGECARAASAHASNPDAKAMAFAYERYMRMLAGDPLNVRDLAMYELLPWRIGQEQQPSKTLIWAATVHAAKTLEDVRPGWVPLGAHLHRELGKDMAVIGFTAVSGQSRRVGSKAVEIPLATPDMLEAKAGPLAADALRYLDHDDLAAMGKVPSRALNYAKPDAADWSLLLDGMVVLGAEAPQLEISH